MNIFFSLCSYFRARGVYGLWEDCLCYTNALPVTYSSSWVHENQNNLVVNYYFRGVEYSILINKQNNKQFKPVISHATAINLDSKEENITEELTKFFGPYKNFHNISITPEELGYKSITVNYFYPSKLSKTFESGDVLSLTK